MVKAKCNKNKNAAGQMAENTLKTCGMKRGVHKQINVCAYVNFCK